MATQLRATYTKAVMMCDTPGCDNTHVVGVKTYSPWQAEDELAESATEAGWTTWYNRSIYHYCPEHLPNPESPMINTHTMTSAPCTHGNHAERCDWVTMYTPPAHGEHNGRQCHCECHKDQP